jgi:hypothetical protein
MKRNTFTGQKNRLAREADDPDYIEAERFYNEAFLESERLSKLLKEADRCADSAYFQVHEAAAKYGKTLKSEALKAHVQQCECNVDD